MWIDQCEVIPPGKGWVEFSLPSTPQSLCLIADLAMATARHFGFQLQMAEELTQAVLEAAGNAVRHGNDLDPDKIVVVRFEKSGSKVTPVGQYLPATEA